MKKSLFCFVWIITSLSLQAQSNGKSGEDGTDIIPVVYGNGLFLEEQTVRGLGGGVIVNRGNPDQRQSAQRDMTQLVALYTRHDLMEDMDDDCPGGYNNLDFLFQRKIKKHQFFTLLKSYSDKPVYGGIETLDFVTGYGFELVNREHHSLWLGASLAVSDWDRELPDGDPLYVLPVPYLHYDFYSRWLDFSFDFTTSPMLDLVIAPYSRIRLNGSALFSDLEKIEDCGVKYDLSLEYRFFSEDQAWGDFAGIRLGYLAEDYEYDMSGRDGETLQIAWKSVYGTLDLSLLELTAAYAFDGRQYYDDGEDDLGSGWSLNLQLAWLF